MMDAPVDDVDDVDDAVGRMAKLVELFEEGGMEVDTKVVEVSTFTFDAEVYLGLKRMLGI